MTRAILVAALFASACAGGPPGPAALGLGEDACASCRMTIVSRATAAQIARPGDEPVFFDDLGCLRDYLLHHPVPTDAIVFVADHRTGAWVDGRTARFTRTGTASPMASGLLAHADEASRDADRAATGGAPVAPRDVLGPLERSLP